MVDLPFNLLRIMLYSGCFEPSESSSSGPMSRRTSDRLNGQLVLNGINLSALYSPLFRGWKMSSPFANYQDQFSYRFKEWMRSSDLKGFVLLYYSREREKRVLGSDSKEGIWFIDSIHDMTSIGNVADCSQASGWLLIWWSVWSNG